MSFSRRDFLALVGTSVAGAAVIGATSEAVAAPTQAGHWVVRSIGAVRHGAVPITLSHQTTGEQLVVDACRRGSARQPVASSRDFDLFLANQGNGAAATPRHHVLAARALAGHLDRVVVAVPASVLTMDARLRLHGELVDTNDDFVVG